jgi:hypothetical protein
MEIAPFKISQIDETGTKQDFKCRLKASKFDKEMPIAFFQNNDKLFYISIQWSDPTYFKSTASKQELLKTPWRREIKLFSMAHDEREFEEIKIDLPFCNWNIPLLANLEFLANDEEGFYLGKKEMLAKGLKVNQVIYHMSYDGTLLDSIVIDINLKSSILPALNLKQGTGYFGFENGVIDLHKNYSLGSGNRPNYWVKGYPMSGPYKDDFIGAAVFVTHNAFGSNKLDLEKGVLWFYGLCVKPNVQWKSYLSYNVLSVESEGYMGLGVPYNQVVLMKYDLETGKLLEEQYFDVQLNNGEEQEVLGSKAISTVTLPKGLQFFGIELTTDTLSQPRLFVVGDKWMRNFDFDLPNKSVSTSAVSLKNKFNPGAEKPDLENQLNYAFLKLHPSENNLKLNEAITAIDGDYRNSKRSVFCFRQGVNFYLFEN